MSDASPSFPSASWVPAPELELPMSDGRRFALRDLRGKPVLISFLSHAA